MALLDFPTGPALNELTTQNGNTWKWNGTSWVAFNNLSLSSQVSGVLGTVYGGTGKALSSLTVGSVLYADTSSSFAALAPSTADYVLATQGAGSPPYWKIDNSGTGSVGNGTTYGFTYYSGLNTVTSGTAFSYIVGPSAGGTGGTIVLTSSTMALIGATITAGTWAGSAVTAKYGGTGLNAISAGQLIYGSATDAYSALNHPGAGYALTSVGSTVAWQQVSTLIVASAGWAITAGSATTTANIYGGGAGSIVYNTGSNATTFLTHSGSATSVLVTTATGIAWTTQNSLFVAYAGGAGTVANVYGGGAGSIVYNTGSNATTFLSHSGSATSVLVTTAAGIAWTTQNSLFVGSASTAAQLNIASATGVGVSYLLFGGGQSGNQPVYSAVGITVMAQDSILYANRLVASGSTASISTSTGALIVGGGVGIGGSLWTNTNNLSSISGLGIISGIVTSGTWAGNAVTLLYGGTNNTVSGSGHSDKVAVYNSTGTAITSFALSLNNLIIGATGGTYSAIGSSLMPIVNVGSNPPAKPGGGIGNTQSGQLWWDNNYGVLKIYYDDGNTQQWVDATPVLGSSGGGSSVKRSYVMTFGAGFTPSLGADSVQIQVPYAPDNTSKYYYIKRLDYRNETVSGGTGVSFYIERFTGGNAAFNAVSSGNRIQTAGAGAASSFVVGPAAYTTSYTLAASGASFVSSSGVAASIISGDYLRLNFTSIVSAATLSVSMVIEEQ